MSVIHDPRLGQLERCIEDRDREIESLREHVRQLHAELGYDGGIATTPQKGDYELWMESPAALAYQGEYVAWHEDGIAAHHLDLEAVLQAIRHDQRRCDMVIGYVMHA